MAEYAITGDVSTLLGGEHSDGDPVAVWVETSQPIIDVENEGRLGGRVRAQVNGDGTFTVSGLPETVSGVAPLYRLIVESLSLRLADKDQGLITGWFPLTTNRNLTWIVANYVELTTVTSQVASNIAAAAALGATNDTATASYVGSSASATAAALRDRFAMGVVVAGAGIDPTGAADSTTAIQAKIDAATAYGAPLYLPEGTYRVGTLVYRNSLTLRGAGKDKTILKKLTTVSAGILSATPGVIGSGGEPIQDLVLEDLTLDGDQLNSTAGTAAEGLLRAYSAARVACVRVRFRNSVGYGVGFQGVPNDADANKRGPVTDIYFESCDFLDNGRYQGSALSMDGIDVKDAERITLVSCYASGNSDKGFNLRGRFITLIGCHSDSNGTGYDFNSHNDPANGYAHDSYVKAFSCSAVGNTGGGFGVSASEDSITHAEFHACDALNNGGNGLGTVAPPSTGKVRAYVYGGNFKRNSLRGIYGDNAQELRVFGASLRDNTGDGARVNNQAGAIFDNCRYEGNGGFGLRALGTCANIDVVGGVFASNTSGPITGTATDFRIVGNPRGLTATQASAATLTVSPRSRPLLTISGTTTITAITATHAGDEVTLLFTSTAQVTDGGNIRLAGNFTGAAGRTLTLLCDGTDWYEKARAAT